MSTATGVALDSLRAYTRHVNPTLGRFLEMTGRGHRLVRAQGCVVEDAEGRRFDDWIAGFGSFNLGHNPPELKAVVAEHLAADPPNLFVESLNPFAGELAARLVAAAGPGFETCFFCNSGSEAVEAALKTAVLATGRSRVAYWQGAYHGTTLGALACMAHGPYRDGLEGVLAAFDELPFADLPALEAALRSGEHAALLLEPVQMEAGVRIVPDDVLRGAREVCHRNGCLLVLDEVQTGMGRTGDLFAFQRASAAPDILVLAKSLGGGLVPIGATVTAEGLWQRAYGGYLRCEAHNSTFGGNALACRVACATLDRLAEPGFLGSVRCRAQHLFGALERELNGSPVVARISWRGLLGGIALREPEHPWLRWEHLGLPELSGRPVSGPLLTERLFRRGILAQVCGHDWSVLRVEPPLVVDDAACDRFIESVADGIRWLEAHA